MSAATLTIAKIFVLGMAMVAVPVLAVWGSVKAVQLSMWGVRGTARGVSFLVRRVFGFVRATILDSLRSVGALLTAVMIAPMALVNLISGRWRSAAHYGRALEDELINCGISLYRVSLGNIAAFLGLGALTDGVEHRVPELVARAPRESRRSKKAASTFPGYKVVGTLPPGGSGAQLFLARPDPDKVAHYRTAGHADPGQVVIKAFALSTGSTLPQIVRESRALEAASRLGLVLEHELSDGNFHYVMPFVPGDGLDRVTRRMHTESGPEGLRPRELHFALRYATDLLSTLSRFHREGLWHKDIKPSNVIVSGERAHLVDLGLVTPLASAMTLTTHGTEYYRDPEMVRLALQGVKVHEVDGIKFDIYSVGACLYSMMENSFPAHGSLSRFTRRVPDAVQWIVRQAMADMNTRYASSEDMLLDLRTVLGASDPYAVKPAHLPSMGGRAPREAAKPVPPPTPRTAGSSSDTPMPTPRRRRVVRRIVAAAAIMAFFAAGLAALIEIKEQREYHSMQRRQDRSALAVLDQAAFRRAMNRQDLRRGDAVAPSAPTPDPIARYAEVWGAAIEDSPLLQSSTASDVACCDEHANERRRVLLLNDLPPTRDSSLVEGLHRALEERSFHVVGCPHCGDDSDEVIQLVAGARAAASLSDPDDPDATLRLEDFLEDNLDLHGIAWVAGGEREGDLPYRLIPRRDARVSNAGRLELGQ